MKKILAGALMSAIVMAMPASAEDAKSKPQATKPDAAKPAPVAHFPADVDVQSGFRLPLPKREDLSPTGQKTYDAATGGASIAGLWGPSGVQLYSPDGSQYIQGMLVYLRTKAGIPANVREMAILTTARAFSNKFEWSAHEPVARQAGVSEKTIDVIRNRRSVKGLPATDALVITLARQTFVTHHVSSKTFAEAKKTFGPKLLLDITFLMGQYAVTAATLTVFDMQLKPGEKANLPMP